MIQQLAYCLSQVNEYLNHFQNTICIQMSKHFLIITWIVFNRYTYHHVITILKGTVVVQLIIREKFIECSKA